MNVQMKLQPKQYRSFMKGGSIQLSKAQLSDDYEPAKKYHNTTIQLNQQGMKKLLKAKRLGKGFRVSNMMHSGGGIFDSVSNAFKSVGNTVKKTANKTVNSLSNDASKTVNAIAKTANTTGDLVVEGVNVAGDVIKENAKKLNRMALKYDLGGYVEQVKDVVPQSALTAILTTALISACVATGQVELIPAAGVLATSATTAFYTADFSRSLKGQGEDVGKAALLSGVKKGVEQGVKSSTTPSKPTTTTTKQGQGIIDNVKSNISGYKQAIMGQTDYTKPVKDLLKKYGNQTITNMVIVRSPVESFIVSALNVVSLGQFREKMKNRNIDQLWHLQMDITLANRQTVAVEKNEVVNIRVGITDKKNQEEKNVTNIPSGLTLNQLMGNCKKYMGNSKFFSYSGKSNNCQHFLVSLMKASSVGNESDYSFIKQSTEKLLEGYVSNIADSVTTLGAKANILMNGGSFKSFNGDGYFGNTGNKIDDKVKSVRKATSAIRKGANKLVNNTKDYGNSTKKTFNETAKNVKDAFSSKKKKSKKNKATKRKPPLGRKPPEDIMEPRPMSMPSESEIKNMLDGIDAQAYAGVVRKFNSEFNSIGAEELDPSNYGDDDDIDYMAGVIYNTKNMDFVKQLSRDYFEPDTFGGSFKGGSFKSHGGSFKYAPIW